MFKKLLSNLAFNPSLIGQVAFYARRLRKEAAIRRAGLFMLSLGLAVQVFAVISPPEPSLASSNSDMITGGFSSQSEAVTHCQQNTRKYQTILAYYGINCQDVAKASTVTLKSTDYNGRLDSMGWLAYGKPGETPTSVPNAGTLYLTYLHVWDHQAYSSYKALKGTTSNGKTFFILYHCGNLVFVGVPVPPARCAWNQSLPASDSKCFEPCPLAGKSGLPKTSPQCVATCPYNKAIASNNPKCFEPCPVKDKQSLPKKSADCYVPCQYNTTISENNPDCKPCESSQTRDDLTSCLEFHKTAANVTESIANANNTTAQPGDVIRYTLSVKNKGKATIKNFVVSENISDVLDYADTIDLGGATKNNDNILAWPAGNISANQTITQQFTVRIKNPLPNTPVSASDPGHYDLTMTNVYGDAVSITLPPSVVKASEIVTRTLPNTGPGTSLTITFLLVFIAAYFFARSRLMARELDIVRDDFTQTGGN